MSYRATQKDIEQALNVLNSNIKRRGVKVHLGGRYGYQALDLYNLKGGCLKTVRTGMTKGETLQCVYDMLEGISLYTRPRTKA